MNALESGEESSVDGERFFLHGAMRVPILMYHKIGPVAHSPFWVSTGAFQRQMLALRRAGYTSMTFPEIFRAFAGRAPMPEKPILITFDDGYESLLTEALGVLSHPEIDFVGTCFIATGLLGRDNQWDREDHDPLARHLEWAQLRELHASGRFDVQSHGVSHARLTALEHPDDVDRELAQSRAELEDRLGKSVRFMAWPYGASSVGIHRAAARAGYHAAVAANGGIETCFANFWTLRRIMVCSESDVDVLRRRSLRDRFPAFVRKSAAYDALRNVKRRLIGPPPMPKETALPSGHPGFQIDPKFARVSIEQPTPPHHLANALYQPNYFTILDERGQGEGKHVTERGSRVTVLRGQRAVYVRDSSLGNYFSLPWGPVCARAEEYRCEARPGRMIYESEAQGIVARWEIDLPNEHDPVERWRVTLMNASRRERRADLFVHAPLECLDEKNRASIETRRGAYDPRIGGVIVQGRDAGVTDDPDLRTCGFIAADQLPDSWDASPDAFVGGTERSLANPIAVERGNCAGSVGAPWSVCGVLHFHLVLKPWVVTPVSLLVGACEDADRIPNLVAQYLRVLPCPRAQQESPNAGWHRSLHIKSPDATINATVNEWSPRQCHFGLKCGARGEFGYRDMLQWAMGCLPFDPELARQRIEEALGYQLADGSAPRMWRPLTQRRAADNPIWLVLAADASLRETGDPAWLDKRIPFLDRGAATIYEHLQRGMRGLFDRRGRHGLCLIRGGDWNDALDGLGAGAESVWLSMAFCVAAARMRAIAESCGRMNDALAYAEMRWSMADAIESSAWDGAWYVRGFREDGAPIGSAECGEGRIYLNTQSWAMLAGLGTSERHAAMLKSIEELLATPWGYRLLWPAYTRHDPALGRITALPAGTAENGSVYTHANAFLIAGLLQHHRADHAYEVWKRVHPANPDRPIACMPTVFHNYYHAPGSELPAGMAGEPWATGSVAWMLQVIYEGFCGLKPEMDGLYLRPMLPTGWTELQVLRRWRGMVYDIHIKNPNGHAGTAIEKLFVDGDRIDPAGPLPREQGVVRVEATMGTRPARIEGGKVAPVGHAGEHAETMPPIAM